MSYTVRADEEMSYVLCENDLVKSVLQNCHLILTTRKGTVPMYREFGLNMDFIDRPIPVAQVMMISEVREALAEYEPRAEFVSLTFEQKADAPGRMIPILEVNINEQNN